MDLKVAADKFKTSHSQLLSADSRLSVGYGLDPSRKGAQGIIVHVMSNDTREQDDLVKNTRDKLPPSWEGFPVYFKTMPAYAAGR